MDATSEIKIEPTFLENHGGPKKAFAFKGALTFETVLSVWKKKEWLLATDLQIMFDLKEVKKTDSAGLALLIALFREASFSGKRLYFVNIPKQLIDIASVSGVESILPIH